MNQSNHLRKTDFLYQSRGRALASNTSSQVLLSLRKLWLSYPDSVRLSGEMSNPSHCGAENKTVQLLVSQGVIDKADHEFTLTPKGQKSVQQSIASHQSVSEFFEQGEVVLDRHDPTILLLAIVKTHFISSPN